jgi:hypothetical protein
MALTDTACRNAKARGALYKLSDSGGLQLWVQPNGAKLWRVAYRFGGKQKLLAIGAYPVISLADARRARDEAKRILTLGDDPSRAKRSLKASQMSGENTFRAIAAEYIAKLRREGRADVTIEKAEWYLSFARPLIGSLDIRKITPADVLAVLRTIERRGRFETARRTRSTIGSVCRFAVATARAENDPTIALRGALTAPVVTPRPAVTDPKAFGALLRAIDGFDGQPTTLAALKLMALLFPRPGELRMAETSSMRVGQ